MSVANKLKQARANARSPGVAQQGGGVSGGSALGRGRSSAGMSLIEVVLVMGILATAFGMLSTTLMANNRTRSINRDTALSAEAARVVFESMRNLDFRNLYASYNVQPEDDPGGAGTAPGATFGVEGLRGLDTNPPGVVGRIVFPEVLIEGEWQLREDLVDADLGLPRDLNGDTFLDEGDHSLDYLVLPVRIELEWEGRFGPRRMTVSAMFTDFRRAQ